MLYNIPTGAKYFHSKIIMDAYCLFYSTMKYLFTHTSNSIYQKSITLFKNSIPLLYYDHISFTVTFQYSSISCNHYKSIYANVSLTCVQKGYVAINLVDGC